MQLTSDDRKSLIIDFGDKIRLTIDFDDRIRFTIDFDDKIRLIIHFGDKMFTNFFLLDMIKLSLIERAL